MCEISRENVRLFTRKNTFARAFKTTTLLLLFSDDDDSDDDDSDDDESDLLGGVKTAAASVVVVSVVVFAPFSLSFENDQKRTRMPFASFFPKEKSFSVLGDIVVV